MRALAERATKIEERIRDAKDKFTAIVGKEEETFRYLAENTP